MATLIERLKSEIVRLEEKHGPQHPYVKDLKEQLRASQATLGQSTQDVFRMQAVPIPKGPSTATTDEDPFVASNLRLFGVKPRTTGKPDKDR